MGIFRTDKTLVNFRLSEQTIRRMDELAIWEANKDKYTIYSGGANKPTRTDVLRMLVDRAYGQMQTDVIKDQEKKAADVNTATKTKGKDACKPTKKASSKSAATAPHSEKKKRPSKKSIAA